MDAKLFNNFVTEMSQKRFFIQQNLIHHDLVHSHSILIYGCGIQFMSAVKLQNLLSFSPRGLWW